MRTIDQPEPNIFIVSRTSEWDKNKSPCDEAFKAKIKNIDIRNAKSPCELNDEYTRENWYNQGSDHRVIDGNIARDMGYNARWVIEVNDVMEFVRKYGQIVINHDFWGFPHIEIYDDYRE